MPRYFYNLNGAVQAFDGEGEEFPDDKAAWKEATRVAAEIFKNLDGRYQPGQEWSLEVTDEQRRPLYFIDIRSRKMK